MASASATTKENATPSPDPKEPKLPPLEATSEFVDLQVPGFEPAVVALPLGATNRRPLVLALHGNFDRPEWQCDVMRGIVRGYAFVLCPRGIPRSDVPRSMDRWEYSGVKRVTEEIDRGRAALLARYGAYVTDGPIVYTGFSLGAILGRNIVTTDAKRYPRVLMTEGGVQGFALKRFKDNGGQRVLFACAQKGCVPNARAAQKQAERFGLEIRIAEGGNVGHTYDGPVARAIAEQWHWLVEGDAQWEGLEH